MKKITRELFKAFAMRMVEEVATHGAAMIRDAVQAKMEESGKLDVIQSKLETMEAALSAIQGEQEKRARKRKR